jgi:hypothetical protein
VRNKAQRSLFEALEHAVAQFPFPISGIDNDPAPNRDVP